MPWTIPGTVLTVDEPEQVHFEELFQSMFLAGGMVLSQVSSVTGLEPYAIQNWVKRGFLSPPQGKRYTLHQLCRILCINTLRGVLPMERICALLGYINGALDDESDDLIDDSALYFLFLRLAVKIRKPGSVSFDDAISQVLADYPEPHPGVKMRIAQALRVMLTGYAAAQYKQEAEAILEHLLPSQAVSRETTQAENTPGEE